jgi:hypothetical protein
LLTFEIHRLYVGRNWLEMKSVKEPLKIDLVVVVRFNSSS